MTQYEAQVMSADDFLEHYGVKGMKWGHRKATTADIHDARIRLADKSVKIAKQKQRVKSAKKAGKSTTNAEAKLHELKTDYLKSPDRLTASRLTKGEKVAVGLLSAAGGPVGLAALGLNRGIEGVARSTVAKRQASGYYDKKK